MKITHLISRFLIEETQVINTFIISLFLVWFSLSDGGRTEGRVPFFPSTFDRTVFMVMLFLSSF